MHRFSIYIVLITCVAALPAATVKTTKAAIRKTAPLTPAGDPLAGLHRSVGETRIDCNAALETVMLLVDLASKAPEGSSFHADARSKFAVYATHPAAVETASLMSHGFGVRELARFSTFLSPAPSFVLNESEELSDLARLLPPAADPKFNLDRLSGYARLVREFYWDTRVGRFLRDSTGYYQQALRVLPVADVPSESRLLFSPLAPVTPEGRIAFTRRTPRQIDYVVLERNAR